MLGPERSDGATGVTQPQYVRAQVAVSWTIFLYFKIHRFLLYLGGSSTRHSRQFALLTCDNLQCFEAKTLHKYKLVFLVKKNYLAIIVITRILFVSNEKADPHNRIDQEENIVQSRQEIPGDGHTLGEGRVERLSI